MMNIILHCLGALRFMVLEQEQNRKTRNYCDIDGSTIDDGKKAQLQREIFSIAVKTMIDALLSGGLFLQFFIQWY